MGSRQPPSSTSSSRARSGLRGAPPTVPHFFLPCSVTHLEKGAKFLQMCRRHGKEADLLQDAEEEGDNAGSEQEA